MNDTITLDCSAAAIDEARLYAGPLPPGSVIVGMVRRQSGGGALARLANGKLVQLNAGVARSVPRAPHKPMTPDEMEAIRKDLGWTGDSLARWAGVSLRALRAWQSGEDPVPRAFASLLRFVAHMQRSGLTIPEVSQPV